MKERPIIFTGDSVRAILAGRKVQSRRVLKPQPEHVSGATWVLDDGAFVPCRDEIARGALSPIGPRVVCPYGAPGSRLYVKESFARVWAHADGPSDDDRIEYRADTDAKRPGGWDAERDAPKGARWMSPRFMPRALSRITLEILSVRVERVQAISEDDARAEGVTLDDAIREKVPACRDVFRYRWDAINGRRAGCSWAASPWVWVLEFRRVEAT